MTTRYLIAAALMASACAAHADVIPSSGVGVINGSSVAGAVGDSSIVAGVNRGAGSDALVQALYQKVSASVGSDMKVSLKQGIDGVYVTGLSTAKAAALAGDGMSVISTPDGFKIVDNSSANGNANGAAGGGANLGTPGPGVNAGTPGGSNSGSAPGSNSGVGLGSGAGNMGNGNGNLGNGNVSDIGSGSGSGSGQAEAAAVPEPSTIALMLAGMLGVAGLGRRRAR